MNAEVGKVVFGGSARRAVEVDDADVTGCGDDVLVVEVAVTAHHRRRGQGRKLISCRRKLGPQVRRNGSRRTTQDCRPHQLEYINTGRATLGAGTQPEDRPDAAQRDCQLAGCRSAPLATSGRHWMRGEGGFFKASPIPPDVSGHRKPSNRPVRSALHVWRWCSAVMIETRTTTVDSGTAGRLGRR